MTALETTTSRGTSRTTLTGLIIAVSMTTIDQTIVALSAPTIQSQLGLTHDGVQWAVNVYLLAAAAFFLLGGRLADIFGHKRVALIGIAAFGITSLFCGLAPTGSFAETWLVTARALQGVSGAIMFPAAIGIVVEAFPQAGRGRAMALFFAITGAMTAVGPIAGGYLTQWTWRAIFWVNVPLAVIAFIIVVVSAKRSPTRGERVDVRGAILVAVGMGLIVFGLQQASGWGWTNGLLWVTLVVGAAFLVVFVMVERRTFQPLVDLNAFKDRGFTIATVATLFSSAAFLSVFFFLSVYGQVTLRLSAETTGLLFLKLFIGFVVASRFGSRLFDRSGAKPVFAIGGAVGAAGFAWLASTLTEPHADAGALFNSQTLPIMVAGAGIGFMFSAATTDAVNRALNASYGEVTAVSQTFRNFGGALGLAILTTLVTQQLTTNLISSFHLLGATTADALQAVSAVSGSSQHTALQNLPPSVAAQFLHLVRVDYADAAKWAFNGMAVAMAVVFVLALLYPRYQARKVEQ